MCLCILYGVTRLLHAKSTRPPPHSSFLHRTRGVHTAPRGGTAPRARLFTNLYLLLIGYSICALLTLESIVPGVKSALRAPSPLSSSIHSAFVGPSPVDVCESYAATREIRNKSHVQLHRWGGGRGGGPEAHTLGTHRDSADTHIPAKPLPFITSGGALEAS